MKRIALIFIFLLYSFFVDAQNFQTIRNGVTATYLTHRYSDNQNLFYEGKHFEKACYQNTGTYTFIKIDSVKNNNYNDVYFPFVALRGNENTENSCVYKKGANWTGGAIVIKPNGDNSFLNKNGDSILIKTQGNQGDKWLFAQFTNGNYFEAEVIDIGSNEITEGLTDQIKTINLSFKNSEGNTLEHPFNGKKIKISENYGLVQGYDFLLFPEDTTAFSLAGLSNPKVGFQNITAREIYDFEVDDIFHIEEKQVFITSLPSYFHKKERIKILSKRISINQDTLEYEVETLSNIKRSVSGETEIELINKTIKFIISSEENKILNLPSLNITPINQDGNYNCSNKGINGREGKYTTYSNYSGETCYSFIMHPTVTYYYKGLGGGYYSGYFDIAPEADYRSLVYYKKGAEEWGTAMDLITGTGTKQSNALNIHISPNPFAENTSITISGNSGNDYTLTVSDVLGKVVKQIRFSGDNYTLEKDQLTEGIYLYKILDSRNNASTGKLVVK
ncbi:MAG: T9SS type A sorting domain-containing protein [Cytophagaceae bacterium]